jgi:hypothetical protein
MTWIRSGSLICYNVEAALRDRCDPLTRRITLLHDLSDVIPVFSRPSGGVLRRAMIMSTQFGRGKRLLRAGVSPASKFHCVIFIFP